MCKSHRNSREDELATKQHFLNGHTRGERGETIAISYDFHSPHGICSITAEKKENRYT